MQCGIGTLAKPDALGVNFFSPWNLPMGGRKHCPDALARPIVAIAADFCGAPWGGWMSGSALRAPELFEICLHRSLSEYKGNRPSASRFGSTMAKRCAMPCGDHRRWPGA